MQSAIKLLGTMAAVVMGALLAQGAMRAPAALGAATGVEETRPPGASQVSCTFYHCTAEDNCTAICGDFAFCDRSGFCTLQ